MADPKVEQFRSAGFDALMAFAQNAAFAMPPPPGVLISGVLAAAQVIIGYFKSEGAPTLDQILASFADDIKSFAKMTEIEQDASDLATLGEALLDWQRYLQTLKQGNDKAGIKTALLGDPSRTKVGYLGTIDAQVGNFGGPLPMMLNRLSDQRLVGDPDVGPAAMDALGMGVGIYLTFLKLVLEWGALLKADAGQSDVVDYTAYEQFQTATARWCAKLAGLAYGARLARLALVGPVEVKYKAQADDNWRYKNHYNFKDAGVMPPAWEESSRDGYAGRWCDSTEVAAQVRIDYLALVGAGLDAHYDTLDQAIATFRSALLGWSIQLKPRDPQAGPAVVLDGKAGSSTGQEARYAFAFANVDGASDWSPWSLPVNFPTQQSFDAGAQVTLTVPVDPLGLANQRQVFRQVGADDSPLEFLAVIPDNTTTQYVDKGASGQAGPPAAPSSTDVLAGAYPAWVPPIPPATAPNVPILAPIGPLSGNIFAVKYAVSFVNAAGESWGPWSTPSFFEAMIVTGVKANPVTGSQSSNPATRAPVFDLTKIPVDWTEGATTRRLYRVLQPPSSNPEPQLIDANGEPIPLGPTVVATFTNNATTTFTDTLSYNATTPGS